MSDHLPSSATPASSAVRHDLPRRAALGLGIAGLLGTIDACSGRTSPQASPSSTAVSPSSTSSSAAGGTSRSSGSLPTKDEIIERFGSRKPKAWNLNLPGEITTVPSAGRSVALTFDACGGAEGSGYDEGLIDLLRRRGVKATLDLNARWIAHNPSLAAELASDPLFRIANHGTKHQPLSTSGRSAYGIKGTESLSALYDEVVSAHDWIAQHCPGEPILFRSGTAYSDDIGVDVCRALGMPFLGYTVNGDGGTTFTPAQVTSALLSVKPGDVVIAHMNQPTHGTRAGFVEALPRLLDRGITFTHVHTA